MQVMKTKILFAFILIVSVAAINAQTTGKREIASGPFDPTWESFIQNYHCPEWFRDAKFGIWAHWSAQCVPEDGDWYARHMYVQGSDQYKFHVEHYGHPSEFGFMELDNLWKADKWEPEKLMALYKKAGAKYFMALANHHDNFDAYNSKYHAWNSVNVGPKKDIVGIWEKVARENGLYFGVSNHSAHAWHWLQTAYGYDAEGPKAGVRYDAYTLKKEDGIGKWWEGLDPQDLYTGPNMVVPDGIKSAKEMADWHEANDRLWTEEPPENNPGFTENWFLRTQDLIDQYKPDMLYFDDFGVPQGQAGFDVIAHYYNAAEQWHQGKQAAVVTLKQLKPGQSKGVVEDFERGFCKEILPEPWQTCTCIGDWHYNRAIYNENRYKSVGQVVDMLIDIVSKNGNLLLSIPMRGDGTIDELEVKFLEGMAAWMEVNSEAIFGTRPWKIYGEGPTQVKVGMFSENETKFTAEDIRYTTKDGNLYAFLLGYPEGKRALIKSLALGSKQLDGKKINKVTLLGYKGELKWKQTQEGLEVYFPDEQPSEHAVALKIEGIVSGGKGIIK
jgi:alpha-L-fucosidase